jgi:hypothetical protein
MLVCEDRLRQLAVALAEYERKHGRLPPPFLTDERGKPMHSWRVLILPFLEEEALYDSYDFDKPWDHPDNLRLEDQMPAVFRCPINGSPLPTTSYLAVVGDHTLWPISGEAFRLGGLQPGEAANIVLLVEPKAASMHWMSPTDVVIDEKMPVDTACGLLGPTIRQKCRHLILANGALVRLSVANLDESLRHYRVAVPKTASVQK